jgi:NADPH2:quinone reductase
VVDLAAAEVNFPDLLVIEGRYQIKPPLPFSPGKCGAGRVAAVGDRVTHLRVGDRAAVQVEYGTYAEKVRAPAAACFPMPDRMDFATAAALGLTYQTAWFTLRDRAGFQAGETVLVLGASGGVGLASIQLARAWGAACVIAAVRGNEREALVREAGADHVVDVSRADLRDHLKDEVARITGSHGADVVVDSVGGDIHAAALRAMAWRGRLVVVGFATGTIPAIKANYLLVKNIAVSGLQWSDYRDRAPERVAAAQAEIFALYEADKLAPKIGRRFALEDFKQAVRTLADGSVAGRIILDVTAH